MVIVAEWSISTMKKGNVDKLGNSQVLNIIFRSCPLLIISYSRQIKSRYNAMCKPIISIECSIITYVSHSRKS